MGVGASLLRFTGTERAFHWAFALAYLLLWLAAMAWPYRKGWFLRL